MSDRISIGPAGGNGVRSAAFLIHAVPALVAVVLSLPCFGFTYQWDDYDFLTNALLNRMGDLLPDPADFFYRPISRGVYFLVLSVAGDNGALLGHILNALFLVGVIVMLVRFTIRLAGPTAGLLAGLTFAGIGGVPTLIGWVCCDQDLLSMLFILVALDLQLSGRRGAALGAAAAALLSKETAIAVIPVLMLLDWILGRRPYRVGRGALSYGLLLAAWAAIHPAVRILLSRGLRSGSTGYVGLDQPEMWPGYFAKYLLTMSNTRITTPIPTWPVAMTGLLLLALALAVTILLYIRRGDARGSKEPAAPPGRVLLLGGLLLLGPLVLSSVIIRSWAPYYSAYPGIGFAILAGSVLARIRLEWQVGFLLVFFSLGVWSRENSLDLRIATEKNFRATSRALRQVSANFKRLVREFPPGPQILLTVEARGSAGLYTHMYTFGALRVWYANPTIRARRPEDRVRSAGPEYLFAVTPDFDVIQIDPETLGVRSASGRDPDYAHVEAAVRAYCTGLYGSGETNRAVNILLRMPEISEKMQSVHWRMAAMYLIADGRIAEGDTILARARPLGRNLALVNLRAVLAEQPPGRVLDGPGLRAFGIGPGDTAAMRDLMRWFRSMKYVEEAYRFAGRLDSLTGGDPEAEATRDSMAQLLEVKRRMPSPPAALTPP